MSSLSLIDPAVARPLMSRDVAAVPDISSTVERIVAGGALLITSPLLLAGVVTVAWMSRRSPFVAHLRVGRNGAPLWVFKLRTMWGGEPSSERRFTWTERIDEDPQHDRKPTRDPRVVSRFAAFCRKHSIDELPQLWQVVRGELALVGPRPLTRGELHRFYGEEANELLKVRPGLSGLWQVSGRSELSREQRKQLDMFLVRNFSWKLYASVLARTLGVVWSGKGAC